MYTASPTRSYFNWRWLVVRYLFASSFACVGVTALAGPNTWTGDGPWGGAAFEVAIDPQNSTRIFAISGLAGPLHHSSDSGATWQRVDFGNASLDDARIVDVEFIADSPQTILVTTRTGLIGRSVDGGATWSIVPYALPPFDGLGIFAKTGNVNTIFIGTTSFFKDNYLHRSVDGGLSWTDVSSTSPGTRVDNLFGASDGSAIYIVGPPDGLYRSVDGGESWTSLTEVLNPNQERTVAAVDPQNANRLFVAIHRDQIYRSNDAGQNWTVPEQPADVLLVYSATGLYVDPNDGNQVFVTAGDPQRQLIKSSDGGLSFSFPTPNNFPNSGITTLQFHPLDSSYIIAGTVHAGLYQSTDGGADWAEINSGFGAPGLDSITVASNGTIYTGARNMFSASADDGATWTRGSVDWQDATPPIPPSAISAAADPNRPGRVLIGSTSAYGRSLHESLDSGQTYDWLPLQIPPEGTGGIRSIEFVKNDPQLLRAVSSADKYFYSSDGGLSFGVTDLQIYVEQATWFDVASSPSNPENVYISGGGSSTEYRLLASDNGGITFQALPSPISYKYLYAVAVHPNEPQTILVGGEQEFAGIGEFIARSVDGGSSWNLIGGTPGFQVVDIEWIEDQPELVYVLGTSPTTFQPTSNLYRSVDGGLTFTAANGGFDYLVLNDMAVDPRDANRVLIAMGGGFGYREYTYMTDLVIDAQDITAAVGQRTETSLVVTNSGSETANLVEFSQTFPANVTISSVCEAPPACTVDGATLNCEGANIAPGDAVTVDLIILPTADSVSATTAAVSSLETDSNIQDNSDSANVVIDSLLDSDGDGVGNGVDNCTDVANAAQRDTDGDGYGNACDADFNNDCIVNVVDLGLLRTVFFSADENADLNGDGVVNVTDLGIMRSAFFNRPGASSTETCGCN